MSLFGSGLTAFAMGVWALRTTGSVTLFSLIAVAATVPPIVLSPLVGALVDRSDRRWMMIVGDAGAAAATAVLVTLLVTGRIEIWHLYLVAAVSASFGTIQFPAFSAATTLLVPPEHYARASGLVQLGEAAAKIVAPLAAGFLLAQLAVAGVIAIDLATFVFAVVTLLLVRVPRPRQTAEGLAARPSLASDMLFGWRYVRRRPGLIVLLAYFSGLNLVVPMALLLTVPLVLAFGTTPELGVVEAVGGAGLLVGSLGMVAWGGPRRKVAGILGAGGLVTVGLVVAGLRPSIPLIAGGLFVTFVAFPVLGACSQAIWQSKVEPDVQGRVFAVRSMVAQVTVPLGFLLAGPLADRVFTPLLVAGGRLDGGPIGRLLGTGPGRGVGLLLVVMGGAFLLSTLLALASRRLRGVEDELPDIVEAGPLAEAAGDG